MPPGKSLLLLGGTSDIGHAIASTYAAEGWSIVLAARSRPACERNARDLETRYRRAVDVVEIDILRSDQFGSVLQRLEPFPDTVICVVGLIGDPKRFVDDPNHATDVLRTNFEGPAILLERVAERMAARGFGTIVGVSSVAGERGRASNYIYGSAKAGFTQFLSGLRNRLAAQGIHVLTVKPGFVRTRMTAGMQLPPLLTATPTDVATAVYRGAERSRKDVIYVLPVWRVVMMIIRFIPERLFKRMRL
jgi:decaprenylphospho-beta-D-erythro-pentofuranosid-2-ulose 2-reductase